VETSDLFATETMAELCARQGRTGEAVAIYRRLVSGATDDERRARWQRRLDDLSAAPPAPGAPPPPSPREPATPAPPVAAPTLRLPLTIREPVRSGQIVYAEGGDLVVLSPVNPGAQLMADGNIHVYAPLRGRAVAGARGCVAARIFCQRLEAELVGIDAAWVAADDIPRERFGKPAQVLVDRGRCVIAPL
jgi:septum site-determining protein MinC